jgi:hypothetical protein
MAKLSSSNPFLFIGKPVRDEYGRQVGRIASFMVSPNGRVRGVFVEHGDGEFFRYPSNQLEIGDDGIVLLSGIKLRVKALCDEIPLIWRKDQALSELLEKKKIPSEMFNDLHKHFESALNQLKSNAKAALENVDKYIAKRAQQMKELQSAMIYLELEREIGKIDEKSYKTATEMIQEGLKWTSAEKSDLETIRNRLSNILLGEEPATIIEAEEEKEVPPAPPAPPTLPEPPVVVHVKSAAKPGS